MQAAKDPIWSKAERTRVVKTISNFLVDLGYRISTVEPRVFLTSNPERVLRQASTRQRESEF
jgi:hypothetical protein